MNQTGKKERDDTQHGGGVASTGKEQPGGTISGDLTRKAAQPPGSQGEGDGSEGGKKTSTN